MHPDSPAGGTGPGFSVPAGPIYGGGDSTVGYGVSDSHQLHSPGREFELPGITVHRRVYAVYAAVSEARGYVGEAVKTKLGEAADELIAGIVPGILAMLALLGLTTAFGAAAGALLGALLGAGVGAAPGAVAGGSLGFEAGVGILGYLGLAFLIAHIGAGLGRAADLSIDAVRIAWHSLDRRTTEYAERRRAAHLLADAAALVIMAILEGLVAFLLERGAGAATRRVPELVAKLKASRLGEGFAVWVERNWQRLVANPRLKPKESGAAGGGGSSAAGGVPAEPGARAAGTSPAAKQQAMSRQPRSRAGGDTADTAPPRNPNPQTTDELAAGVAARAAAAEKKISPDIIDVANKVGAKRAGWDQRLKTKKSIADKIGRDAAESGESPAARAGKVNDSVRYTMTFEPKEYTAGVAKAEAELQARGYQILKRKNTWGPDSQYQGINTTVRSPNGDVFELQYHTTGSFAAKQRSHELYELQRSLPEGHPDIPRLRQQQIDMLKDLEQPPGVDTIPSKVP